MTSGEDSPRLSITSVVPSVWSSHSSVKKACESFESAGSLASSHSWADSSHSPAGAGSIHRWSSRGGAAANDRRSLAEITPTTFWPDTTGAPLTFRAERFSIASRRVICGARVITCRVIMSRNLSMAVFLALSMLTPVRVLLCFLDPRVRVPFSRTDQGKRGFALGKHRQGGGDSGALSSGFSAFGALFVRADNRKTATQ